MDFTNIKCISEQCKHNNVTMGGHGGNFGGRFTTVTVKCRVCGLTLLVVPMRPELEYSVSAMTKEERREESQNKTYDRKKIDLMDKIVELAKDLLP